MTPVEYLKHVVGTVLPRYKIFTDKGYTIDDFVAKFATKPPVIFISFNGYSRLEGYENGGRRKYKAKLKEYSIYVVAEKPEALDCDIDLLDEYLIDHSTFEQTTTVGDKSFSTTNEISEPAGNATLFTKGFDSFELTVKISNN